MWRFCFFFGQSLTKLSISTEWILFFLLKHKIEILGSISSIWIFSFENDTPNSTQMHHWIENVSFYKLCMLFYYHFTLQSKWNVNRKIERKNSNFKLYVYIHNVIVFICWCKENSIFHSINVCSVLYSVYNFFLYDTNNM